MTKITLLVSSFLLCACQPINSDQSSLKPSITNTSNAMVVSANPHATTAGIEILNAGGSAIDAAIAIEAVLSLVEPQSSGLGGGAFMTYFDNTNKKMMVYDGRETAPSNATSSLFLDNENKPFSFIKAKNSGLSIGVPGVVAMFELAHKEHGQLPWGQHFKHARNLAINGFEVSPRLHGFINRFGKYIPKKVSDGPIDAYHYFHDQDGKPLAIGARLQNHAYAKTLESIAQDPRNFYRGDIAKAIIEQVQKSPRAGNLKATDIANYTAQKRQALCVNYRSNKVCGPQPASSWVSIGNILGLLEHGADFSKNGADDPTNWAYFAQAQRLAYADRDRYVADDNFVQVPISGMLDDVYLKQRSQLLSLDQVGKTVGPGEPWDYQAAKQKRNTKITNYGKDATLDIAGTTHFVVVDKDGNVVSMTASVESIFGSTRMAGGMFLNNQLTDFSFKSKDDQGQLIANRVEANKRPRSSMSPTIILNDNNDFLMATGSPGGSSIIAYNAKTIIGVLDWGLSPQQAIDLPNVVARKGKVRIEKSRASQELIDGLRAVGFAVHESAGENSGFSMVLRHPDGQLEGGVDTRREGTIKMLAF